MGRSRWKGPFIHYKFLKLKIVKTQMPIVWLRSSVVLTAFVGFKFLVHTGKIFKKFFASRDKIGYKFGEFIPTRSKCIHKNKLALKSGKAKKKK